MPYIVYPELPFQFDANIVFTEGYEVDIPYSFQFTEHGNPGPDPADTYAGNYQPQVRLFTISSVGPVVIPFPAMMVAI